MNKEVSYALDFASVSAFLGGVITGATLLMLLGGMASVLAAVNHGIDIYRKLKKK